MLEAAIRVLLGPPGGLHNSVEADEFRDECFHGAPSIARDVADTSEDCEVIGEWAGTGEQAGRGLTVVTSISEGREAAFQLRMSLLLSIR